MFDSLLSVLKHIWSNRIIKFIIFFITSYILLNAIGGLIGNSTYLGSPPTWMKSAWEQVSKFVNSNLLTITSVTSIVSLILLCFLWNRALNISRALNATTSLTELDDSLLRLVTNLLLDHKMKSKEELEREMRRLLHELLRDATQTVLGHRKRGRAAILFPNLPSPNEEYLVVIASHRLSSTSIARMKFYVGKDESKEGERGTVGVAYLTKRMCIGHIVKKKGYWECDDENFINFDEGRSQLPYQSFVNVPIIGLPTGDNSSCLGVICLDSQIPNGFDSNRAKTLLEAIARRATAALTIYMQLLQEQNYSVPYFDKVS